MGMFHFLPADKLGQQSRIFEANGRRKIDLEFFVAYGPGDSFILSGSSFYCPSRPGSKRVFFRSCCIPWLHPRLVQTKITDRDIVNFLPGSSCSISGSLKTR